MASKEPLHGAHFLLSETAHERLPVPDREVCFIGRSNVGKSSLICAVTENWKLARVSKTPGQTRAINVFEVRKGRWLVDLPGYGYAVGPARQRHYWPEMIGKYLGERATLARAYVILDAETGPGAMDHSTVEWLLEHQIPFRVIGGKTDKVGGSRLRHQQEKIANDLRLPLADMMWVSAKGGLGLPALRQDIIAALEL